MTKKRHRRHSIPFKRMIVVIHDLKREGLSISDIARRTGLDRKTVRKYLEKGLETPVYGPRTPRERLAVPFSDYLHGRLNAFPGLPPLLLRPSPTERQEGRIRVVQLRAP